MRARSIQLTVVLMLAVLLVAGADVASAASKKQIAAKLKQPISVSFDQTPLDEVIAFFRTTLNVNIVLDDEAGDTQEKFITLHLKNVPARSVLRWVARLAGLDYTVTEDMVYIAPRKKIALTGRAYFRQYDVNDLLVPLYGALRRGDDDDDDNNNQNNNNDNANDNNNRRLGRRAERELMTLILLFTGGKENWDVFGIIGSSDEDEDDSNSEEDTF